MKPIEPGCECMVINSVAGNNGLIVTAIRYLGEDFFDENSVFNKGRVWEIDKKVNAINHHGHALPRNKKISEYNLRRLDDYEPTEEEIAEAQYNTYDEDIEIGET